MPHLRCPAGVMVAAGFHVGAPYGRTVARSRAGNDRGVVMGERRARSFTRAEKDIVRVAENGKRPQQPSFDEILPGMVHGWERVTPTEYGYIAECVCGWRSLELPWKEQAHSHLRRHITRTPQGNVLQRTLAKRGRGTHGA